jgi:predicted glycosyltransferase
LPLKAGKEIAVSMKKILVYSHDTYGLGNLRRMVGLSEMLLDELADVTLLLMSGSPLVHAFRLRERMDYIKLPCLTRRASEDYAVKSLCVSLPETIRLRADVLLAAVKNFQPDLVLVDKKPCGLKNELKPSLDYLRENLPQTKAALVLRDILDAPAVTRTIWQSHDYYDALDRFYESILVMGRPEIFDPRREYAFPESVARKVKFCGYLRRATGERKVSDIRNSLGLRVNDRLAVVTPGGGQDAFPICAAYLESLTLKSSSDIFSLMITGPEMSAEQQQMLRQQAATIPRVSILEFTDDLMSLLAAADLVVAMAGYNTVCEILSLRQRALLIPRVEPVQEQLLRAEQLAQQGFVRYLHPAKLSAERLRQMADELLTADAPRTFPAAWFDARRQVTQHVSELLAWAEVSAQ